MGVKIANYKPPLPAISRLNKVYEWYDMIYNYSKSKINKETQMVMAFLKRNVEKMDMKNVDIIEEALGFHDELVKLRDLKVQGSTKEIEKGETLEGTDQIIRSLA